MAGDADIRCSEVSYGRTYLTPDNTSIAIVPLGYADGIHRSASGFDMEGAKHVEKPGGPVRIMTTEGPKLYRVCGRVCMDQFIVDLHGSAAELGEKRQPTAMSRSHSFHATLDA